MATIDERKIRPSDGDETEKQEEARRENSASEEEIFEEFVSQAEKEYEERRSRDKETLEKLKKERGFGAEDDGQQDSGKPAREPRKIYGDEVAPQKVFSLEKDGIFNRKGVFNNFGQSGSDIKIKKALRNADLRGVSVKKRREFMQLLGKYHGLKGKNTGTLGRDEVMKFEAGLRRGSSDARFGEFTKKLKEEGVIRNSEDVKKLFNRREARKMSNALTGKEDELSRFNRENRADLIRRRTDAGGPQGPGRGL